MLMDGRPARLPGTVNTSFTYVSTGDREEIVDRAGAGPIAVGQSMKSHLPCDSIC